MLKILNKFFLGESKLIKLFNAYNRISDSDDDNDERSSSYDPNWSFTGNDPEWSNTIEDTISYETAWETTGYFTGDYGDTDSQEGDSADSSLDLACGFNFQNKFWLLGGWNNSRQV